MRCYRHAKNITKPSKSDYNLLCIPHLVLKCNLGGVRRTAR